GEGYHDVPPTYTGTFMPPKLTWPSAPIIEDWVSDLEDESKAEPSQNDPSFVQPTEQVKTPRSFVKPVEHLIPTPKRAIPKPKTHGNIPPNERKVGNRNVKKKHVVPIAVLTRSKLVPLTTARPVTTAVYLNNVTRPRPSKTIVTKPYSLLRRTINRRPSPPASNFPPKLTTIKTPKVNVVKGVQGNWVWKPKCPILDHVSRHSSALITLKGQSTTCSKEQRSYRQWMLKAHDREHVLSY
nr:hypothetical protein [Tanacetum cinerariifolium]